jgi:hypothetical protein
MKAWHPKMSEFFVQNNVFLPILALLGATGAFMPRLHYEKGDCKTKPRPQRENQRISDKSFSLGSGPGLTRLTAFFPFSLTPPIHNMFPTL